MKKLVSAIVVLFVLVSCSKERIIFKYHEFEQKTTLPCNEQCTFVRMVIPIALDKSAIADSINAKLLDVAKEVIYFDELQSNQKLSYQDIMTSFIDSFESMQEQYPEEIIPWEATLEGKEVYQSDELINIEVAYYNYSGGVHGFSGIKSLLFDKVDGHSLSKQDLFKDQNAIEKIAEAEFRKVYNIPKDASINSTGFFFENDQFHLPKTFFITDKGLMLYYNTYEIKATKEEPLELLLPFELVGSQLNYR